jgi:hypothetical protein
LTHTLASKNQCRTRKQTEKTSRRTRTSRENRVVEDGNLTLPEADGMMTNLDSNIATTETGTTNGTKTTRRIQRLL